MTNHLWQSTLFAVAAGLLTLAFRKNRAQVRYWLWFSASVKFLIPLSILISLGSRLEWTPVVKTVATQAVTSAMVQIAQPFPETVAFAPPTAPGTDWTPVAIVGIWACGFAAIMLLRFLGWLRIRAALRSSASSEIIAPVEVRSSPGLLEPGVVGFVRPILLLPGGIERYLTPHQMEAVLAHELCHVRRRDNLTSAMHMVVEAVFWFHPLVWWIGARLVEERERACDEEVLRLGSEPQIYAQGILNVCKLYSESPLDCVSGVTGSNLKKRIEAIMINRVVLNLNFAKKAALAVAGIAALAIPIAVGVVHAPSLRAQSPSRPIPRFQSVSIAACGEGGPPAGPPVKSSDNIQQKSKSKGPVPASGRLDLQCATLGGEFGLIHMAYIMYPTAEPFHARLPIPPITGGPAWLGSDLYDIHAIAEGTPSHEMLVGPMMRALLEDRFKLKTRREDRVVPVYALTVSNSGPRLQSAPEGSCIPIDLTKRPPQLPQGQKYCNYLVTRNRQAPNAVVIADDTSLDDFAKLLSLALDRPVIDRSGIAGRFRIRLEFGIDLTTPKFLPGGGMDAFAAIPQTEPAAPSVFTVIQEQLGLKLEPTNGPQEFLVIDHVEKPSLN